MNVWLVTVGEQLPIDPGDSRPLRTGLLARFLCQSGHNVLWWTSTFNHVRKCHRSDQDQVVQVDQNLSICLLHSVGYRRHVSLTRLIDHIWLARKFAVLAPLHGRPDVMIVSLPTIELAAAACAFARKVGVPVILDIRDLWPDIFLDLVPTALHSLTRMALFPLRKLVQYSCRSAVAIIGPAAHYVEWGIAHAKRDRTTLDREFPFAYSSAVPSEEAVIEARAHWQELGISETDRRMVVCFFGVLGRQFDLDTVIRAARILEKSDPDVCFVICGTGDRETAYRRLAAGCTNVMFPGWVGAAAIWTLMRMSALGLAPYCSGAHFNQHLPNKPIEYLSASLPVVTSLNGALGSLLAANDCGVSYRDGDAEDLARQVATLLRDRVRLRELSSNAGDLYHRCFEAERVYPRMVRYLEDIASAAVSTTAEPALT